MDTPVRMRFVGINYKTPGAVSSYTFLVIDDATSISLSNANSRAFAAFDLWRYYRVVKGRLRTQFVNSTFSALSHPIQAITFVPGGQTAPTIPLAVESPHTVWIQSGPPTTTTLYTPSWSDWLHIPISEKSVEWLITQYDVLDDLFALMGSVHWTSTSAFAATDQLMYEYDFEVEFKTPADPSLLMMKEFSLGQEDIMKQLKVLSPKTIPLLTLSAALSKPAQPTLADFPIIKCAKQRAPRKRKPKLVKH